MTLRPWQSALLAGIGAQSATSARMVSDATQETVGARASRDEAVTAFTSDKAHAQIHEAFGAHSPLARVVTRALREGAAARQHHVAAHGDCGR